MFPRDPHSIFSIPSNHPAVLQYQKIRPDLLKNLKLCGSFSLTLVLRGLYASVSKPAIHIICENPSEFQQISTDLDYSLLKGKPTRLNLQDKKDLVFPGASIGTNRKTGSFGGYLSDEQGVIYGLTSFHVLASDASADIKDTPVYQPSPEDSDVKKNMQKLSTRNEDACIKVTDLFSQDENLFGRCIGGKMNTCEDWALFKVIASRQAQNKVPILESYKGRFQEEIKSIADPTEGSVVYKYGRTSGGKQGRINGVKADVSFDGQEPTAEWCVPSGYLGNFFALEGDSGSWVINKFGAVIGHVFAGSKNQFDIYPLIYITPLKFILERIYSTLNLKVHLLRN